MRRRCAVQRKVPCLFVTEVKEEPSAKRERQPFEVLATDVITGKVLEADIYSAIPTEMVDGTCCFVTTYKSTLKIIWNLAAFPSGSQGLPSEAILPWTSLT